MDVHPGPSPALGEAGGTRDAGSWRVPLESEGAPLITGAVCMGDPVRLSVPPMDRASSRAVVVLWGRPGAWEVLQPREPAEEVRLSELAPGDAGERALDVRIPGPPGMVRLAVAYPLADLVRWDLPEEARWDAVREAVAAGEVPLTYFRLHVVAAG